MKRPTPNRRLSPNGPTLVSMSILLAAVAVLAALAAAISTSDPQQVSRNSPASVRQDSTTTSSARRRPSNKTTRRPPTSSTTSSPEADPMEIAREQARLMRAYNNTPPLFVTKSQDLWLDVARFSAGSRLTTLKAIDLDGDQLEYSIRPAALRDASAHFSIGPMSGELRLTKPFSSESSQLRAGPMGDPLSPADSGTFGEETDEQESEQDSALGKNLYFLNVAVSDGSYENVMELQVHLINSSSIASLQGASSPVQLTPEGGRRAGEQMEELIRRKAGQFYDKLNKMSNTSSQAVIYPDFVNPALVPPVVQEELTPTTTTTTTASPDEDSLATDTTQPTSQVPLTLTQALTPVVGRLPAELSANQIVQADNSVGSQRMLATLVVVCSCLTIILVLLMFLIPISVKKLRKRLKHVEQQHQHLSKQTSHGSSTVCSSSSGSVVTHSHGPSLSQFTLGSDASSCHRGQMSACRQSSLDSNMTAMTRSQVPHVVQSLGARELVANPTYLQQQQYLGQSDLLSSIFSTGGPQNHSSQTMTSGNKCDNVYYPIDDPNDSFYSTINTDSTAISGIFHQAPQFMKNQAANTYGLGMVNYDPPEMKRFADSPVSDSGSSTRSLARFLSLPARQGRRVQPITDDSELADELILDSCDTQQVASKTIARSSRVDREQHDTNWELERHRLRFLEILDEGQFGLVWRCILRRTNTDEQVVAVKTLKSSTSRDERGREDLLAEIEIMKRVCHHPNVVRILHCCTSDAFQLNENKPILLVMEYAELGKLQSFLEKSRQNHHYATTNLMGDTAQTPNDHLTSRDLIKFIYHIAKGMEYIASQCIVHRDLASRNILVSSQRICKIGDFGMARHMQSQGDIYERHSKNSKIPVRWMAPEVLLNNKFTTKSDVFSFGILMWEIVTLGSTPYRHMKTEQVIEKVARAGQRPVKPQYCHTQLYQIMSTCWLHNPDERPSFKSLVRQLDEMLLSANDYIELDQYPDHDYYNIPKTAAPYELL